MILNVFSCTYWSFVYLFLEKEESSNALKRLNQGKDLDIRKEVGSIGRVVPMEWLGKRGRKNGK